MLVRTTLRIKENLKRIAELKAIEKNTSVQSIFNQALEYYFEKEAQKKARKIVFKTHNLGVPLDNLRRSDYYSKVG